MLSTLEQLLFIGMVAIFGGWTVFLFYRMYRIVMRGRATHPYKDLIPKAVSTLLDIGLQRPIFKARPLLSTFHAMIFFGFSYYLLVNLNDVLEGFLSLERLKAVFGDNLPQAFANGYDTSMVSGLPLAILNLLGDVLSMGVLIGMIAFIIRRVRGADKRLYYHDNVLLNPKVKQGRVKTDSLIVGGFIMVHIGSRFLGQALRLAEHARIEAATPVIMNPMQPFASLVSVPLRGLDSATINFGVHATWWLAIGLILVFLPYFAISKHLHLMMAPLNLILKRQKPVGELDAPIPPHASDDNKFEPGAKVLDDLAWPRILDAYACIMCNRCQDVCPAYHAGTPLSPSALEINKRYYINQNFSALAGSNGFTPAPLLETVISSEAVWSCTTCMACVQVCPVGNEPMFDIIDIRRRMILDAPGEMDGGIQSTLETIAKSGNSFGQSARKRSAWTKNLDFEVKDITKDSAEYLWFVGDYASYDPRVVPHTQAVAKVFAGAGVDFGILGKSEKNAGNDVRRVGEEGLFEMLVEDNMAAIGETEFKKIVTTDPHTLNTLRNEYPQFGGNWPVYHYTAVLLELIESGKIKLKNKLSHYSVTYHDPCYLGRYNGGFAAPRRLLELVGVNLIEMPRNRENSFCCGAGGGQIWQGSTPDGERPAENRIKEALTVLPSDSTPLFVVACPKDVVMYGDAVKSSGNEGQIEVRDIIQLIVEAMGQAEAPAEKTVEAEA
jgi:Fe-S oxidoreductase